MVDKASGAGWGKCLTPSLLTSPTGALCNREDGCGEGGNVYKPGQPHGDSSEVGRLARPRYAAAAHCTPHRCEHCGGFRVQDQGATCMQMRVCWDLSQGLEPDGTIEEFNAYGDWFEGLWKSMAARCATLWCALKDFIPNNACTTSGVPPDSWESQIILTLPSCSSCSLHH